MTLNLLKNAESALDNEKENTEVKASYTNRESLITLNIGNGQPARLASLKASQS